MGLRFGTIKKCIDTVRRLTFQTRANRDEEALLIQPSGYEGQPIIGDKAVVGSTGTESVMLGVSDRDSYGTLNPGESRVFSRSTDGAVVASIKLHNTGKISILSHNNNEIDINGATVDPSGRLQVKGIDIDGKDFMTHTHDLNIPATPYALPTGEVSAL